MTLTTMVIEMTVIDLNSHGDIRKLILSICNSC